MIHYREPIAADAAALSALGQDTFRHTFGHLYVPENLQAFLEEVHSVKNVLAELSNPERCYLLAFDDAAMIGYCKLSVSCSLPLSTNDRAMFELKQLYLRDSHFGLGIADHLMRWAIDEAKQKGADALALSVFSENIRGQRFYQRFGFEHVGEHHFKVGTQLDHDFLYRLGLG